MNVTRPLFYLVPLTLLGSSALAQDNEAAPAPPSIGTDIPLTYFGPTPSGALLDPRDRALVGEV